MKSFSPTINGVRLWNEFEMDLKNVQTLASLNTNKKKHILKVL